MIRVRSSRGRTGPATGITTERAAVAGVKLRAGERRVYARDDGTPGWEALEEVVGGLEGGSSVSFASGMAGIAAVFDQLPAGSVVVIPDDCYQGIAGLAKAGQSRGRWTVHRPAVTDTAGWIEMCGDPT